MIGQNSFSDNKNIFFNRFKKDQPQINITLYQANQLNEIPLDHLDETVFVSDFDFTIKYPRFIPTNTSQNTFIRNGATLRGGFSVLKTMQLIKEQAWGYYIASAASPSKITAEAMVTEMQNIYAGEKTDISGLFVRPSIEKKTSEPVYFNVLEDENHQLEQFPRCYIYQNIILNNYDKAAGTIIKIKNTEANHKKISKIIFVDDFVVNALYFPNDFLNYISNIKDKLADSVTIVSVWLDPSLEIETNKNLRATILNGYENSFSEEYSSYINCFCKDPNKYLDFKDYKTMLTTVNQCIAFKNA